MPSFPGPAQLPRPCPAFRHLQYGKAVDGQPFLFDFFIQVRGEPVNKATNILISWESTFWTQRFCIGWKYHLDSHSFSFVWTACIPTPNYSKLASFPGPAQLSITISGRGPGIFSHVSDVRIERMGLIVCGCTGPRTAKRANIAGNLPHVSS